MPPEQTKEMGGSANPMLGHSSTVIFTRVTGHPDYPEVDQWYDSSECWICDCHNKFSFRVANCHEMLDKEFSEISWIGSITRALAKERAKNMAAAEEALGVLQESSASHGSESGRTESETESDCSEPRKQHGYHVPSFDYLKKPKKPAEKRAPTRGKKVGKKVGGELSLCHPYRLEDLPANDQHELKLRQSYNRAKFDPDDEDHGSNQGSLSKLDAGAV